MMKLYGSYILLAVSSFLSVTAFAQTDLNRSVSQIAREKQAEVTLSFFWHKPVRARDVMCRPARFNAGRTVIGHKTQKTSCKGFLTLNNQVVFPSLCAQNDDFQLKKIEASFVNGAKVQSSATALSKKGEIAYLSVSPLSVQGLQGVALATVQDGKTLVQEVGTQPLISFFRKYRIPAKHHFRVGMRYPEPLLTIGDGFFHNGRLIALVQTVPYQYTGFLGGISESCFALIRR